jgi:NAD(P)-dependent dehydrogenase (short-subunit alcohol dehydrogenase family)
VKSINADSDKRVVIVTGLTSGISRGEAELLLPGDCRIVFNSRIDEKVGESIAAHGGMRLVV